MMNERVSSGNKNFVARRKVLILQTRISETATYLSNKSAQRNSERYILNAQETQLNTKIYIVVISSVVKKWLVNIPPVLLMDHVSSEKLFYLALA